MADAAPDPLTMTWLQSRSAADLLALANAAGLTLRPNLDHGELVANLLHHELQQDREVQVEGVLELLPEGFGFLRSPWRDYRTGPEDVFVSPATVRGLNLKSGHRVRGPLRGPRGNERFFALQHAERVNDGVPAELAQRVAFAARQAIVPRRRLPLSATTRELRALELLAPWCLGHRALLVAPPTWPRAALLGRLAHAVREAAAEPWLCVGLLDQRPEDAAAVRMSLAALDRCDVVVTTFDEPPSRHLAVAELLLARAMHEVEAGADVVLLLDSLTALARAANVVQPASGRWLCPGLDATALQPGKRVFAAARACADGGSLTVLATAIDDAHSVVDAAVLAEFAHRGNSDVVVDAAADDALPFDGARTFTRREDDPRSPAACRLAQRAREHLQAMPADERRQHLAACLDAAADDRDHDRDHDSDRDEPALRRLAGEAPRQEPR